MVTQTWYVADIFFKKNDMSLPFYEYRKIMRSKGLRIADLRNSGQSFWYDLSYALQLKGTETEVL